MIDHVMTSRVVSATEFKAKCLGLIEEVETTGGTITVTRRGRPVVVVRRVPKGDFKSPMGILAGKVKIAGDIVNTPRLWDGFGRG